MFTRDEFEDLRIKSGEKMAKDEQLHQDALGILVRADRYYWIHQTNWLGEPILQLPQDMFALQEIIYKTRPRFIIEVGVAWGGSLLFYSTLMEILGGEKVIGIDIYIPDDLMDRINSKGRISDRIYWINNSSVADTTIEEVKKLVGDSRNNLVVLDSNHTHDHVLQELRLYSQIVGNGYYLVCGDTIIEHMPEKANRERPWGPGNNPKTALDEFLEENDRFVVDKRLNNKLLFTCNTMGYLKCIKDA